jgi:DNA repair protein RecN (Recombination protein N)
MNPGMLKNLYIKDFALMEKLEIEFQGGLNILLGETGSGKSLLIDALILLCGGRASSDYVRTGAKKSILEATFDINSKEISELLEENEIDDNDELILRRDISAKGSSRAFVNDSPVTLNLLRDIGNLLADFHGQHDHQLLLNKDNHVKFLDAFAGNQELVDLYKTEFTELKKLINLNNELIEEQEEFQKKYEHISFEYEEIEKIDPKPGEYDEINKELALIENSEFIFNSTNEVYERLYNTEYSAREQLLVVKRMLRELSGFSEEFAQYINECDSAIISIEEIAKHSKSYASQIEFDEEKITELRERMSELNLLRKKYGSYEALIERRKVLADEIMKVESFDQEIKKSEKRIIDQKKNIQKIAAELSENRKTVCKNFENGIESKLSSMGIANSKFDIQIWQEEIEESISSMSVDSKKLQKNGIDLVRFNISTNLGETPKPLADIASGGEISRVMLSIKNLVADSDSMPLLVFDEIDTGISGRIAQKVGIQMRELAKSHQIISITHLPQIAALADEMIKVTKTEDENRATISAEILDKEEIKTEIARLIGGETISESSLQSAMELINFSG